MKQNHPILIGFFLGVTATLATGMWRFPEKKEKLKPDVHYTWLTTDDRRVDVDIEDGRLALHVGTHDQKRAFFQIQVIGNEISTYHSLNLIERPNLEDGVNLDSKDGEVTNFTVKIRSEDTVEYLRDMDGDLKFDSMLGREKNKAKKAAIEYTYTE